MTISHSRGRANVARPSSEAFTPKAAEHCRTPKRGRRCQPIFRALRFGVGLLRRFSKTQREAVNASAAAKITERSLRAALEEQSIQQQQDHGANDRHDPAGRIIFACKNAADPSADKRAGDAKQDRDDETAGILSRHQQFRYGTDYETDNDCPKNMHNQGVVSVRFVSGKKISRGNELTIESLARIGCLRSHKFPSAPLRPAPCPGLIP
jgi:hypothetical protein